VAELLFQGRALLREPPIVREVVQFPGSLARSYSSGEWRSGEPSPCGISDESSTHLCGCRARSACRETASRSCIRRTTPYATPDRLR
jgi:hypothetical protein